MELKTEEYRVGLRDQITFIGAWLKRNWLSKTNRRRFLLYTLIIVVLTGLTIKSLADQFTGFPSELEFVLFILLALLALANAAIWAALMVFALGPLLVFVWQVVSYPFSATAKRRQTVCLSATGLTKQVGDTTSEIAWHEMHDFEETRTTLLFFTGANSALIVPKRGFAAREDAAHFAETARSRYTDAKSVF